jgi:hypothetical protein
MNVLVDIGVTPIKTRDMTRLPELTIDRREAQKRLNEWSITELNCVDNLLRFLSTIVMTTTRELMAMRASAKIGCYFIYRKFDY